MTSAEIVQLILVIGVAAYIYWRWVMSQNDREARLASKQRGSTTYEVTQTGSLFVPRFDPYVHEGDKIYIPTGDGLYVWRIKKERAAAYKAGLKTWLERGAIINLIITSPSAPAQSEWQPLKDQHPDTFNVYFLDRQKVSGPTANTTRLQIGTLDTFHPVILIAAPDSESAPGAMWIEDLHPMESKYAYRVDFVAPADAVNDDRLEDYRRVYESLLIGTHVTLLASSRAEERQIAA